MKIVGIVLVVFGVLALAVGGFSYTKRDKVVDLGPIQASVERQHTVPLSPIAGIAAIAGGVILIVVGSRTRA